MGPIPSKPEGGFGSLRHIRSFMWIICFHEALEGPIPPIWGSGYKPECLRAHNSCHTSVCRSGSTPLSADNKPTLYDFPHCFSLVHKPIVEWRKRPVFDLSWPHPLDHHPSTIWSVPCNPTLYNRA